MTHSPNTAAQPAPADTREVPEQKIDQVVKVYLQWDGGQNRWVIDPLSFDGAPLDSIYTGVDTDLNESCWTDGFRAQMKAAESVDLPTGEELFLRLWADLPKRSRITAALNELTAAAGNWGDELMTYIAKGSEEHGMGEDAQSQRDAAKTITDAIALLRG